jgi:hypothetical protein
MIFIKNWELVFLEVKGKPTRLQRNRHELAQNTKNNSKDLRDETRADMCIPGGLLFMRGVVPSFPFAVLVAAS